MSIDEMNRELLHVKELLGAYIAWIEFYGDRSWNIKYINRDNAQIVYKAAEGHDISTDFKSRIQRLEQLLNEWSKTEFERRQVSF